MSSAAHLVSKTLQIWYLTTWSFNRQVAIPVDMVVLGIVTVLVIVALLVVMEALVIMATVVIGPKPLHGKHVLVVPKLCSLLFFTDHWPTQRGLTSSGHALYLQ